MPVLAGAVTMTLTDRHFGPLSSTRRGRRPVLYQHIFWFSATEVYVVALPAFGVIRR